MATTEPEFRSCADAASLAQAVAAEFVAVAGLAIASRGVCRVALSGGSTPRGYHRLLSGDARFRELVEWERIEFYWGDERCVPPEHADCNYRMAYETLLSPLSIADRRIFRIRGELSAEEGAAEYEKLLQQSFGGAPPRFDLLLLGMGADGHTASLFPGTPGLEETQRSVTAVRPATAPHERITLTFPVLNAARCVIFAVSGQDKAPIVRAIRENQTEAAAKYPAARVRPEGRLLWLTSER
jgi:6-phosphogluconolactonase